MADDERAYCLDQPFDDGISLLMECQSVNVVRGNAGGQIADLAQHLDTIRHPAERYNPALKHLAQPVLFSGRQLDELRGSRLVPYLIGSPARCGQGIQARMGFNSHRRALDRRSAAIFELVRAPWMARSSWRMTMRKLRESSENT